MVLVISNPIVQANLLDCFAYLPKRTQRERFVRSLTFLPFKKGSQLVIYIQDLLRVLAKNSVYSGVP